MFYKDKLVLVTGGTGFVGIHIVEELLKAGARVRIPVHRRPLMIDHPAIEKVHADLMKEEDCQNVVKDVDYVFHAAGAVSSAAVTVAGPMEAITTNLILNARMLQAAWSARVKRFLIFSSSTGYPAVDYPVKEDQMWTAQPHPVYFGYGWMRRYLEILGEFVASKSDTKVAIVRPTAVYGRWDNFDPLTGHVVPALIKRAVAGENPFIVWGTGDEIRDFLHISDLAKGCLLMLEKHAVSDPVNIGYGAGITIKKIVTVILDCAGRRGLKIIFDSSKPTTIPVRLVDISKAKKLLGFEPKVSFEEGMRDLVNWYVESIKKTNVL